MKNFVQPGQNLTVPAPAAVKSGDVVFVGSIFGIASCDAASGEDLTLVTGSVFELPKVAAEAVTVGAPIYYDSAESLVTVDDAEGANTMIGVAVTAAANPSASVNVRLNPAF